VRAAGQVVRRVLDVFRGGHNGRVAGVSGDVAPHRVEAGVAGPDDRREHRGVTVAQIGVREAWEPALPAGEA
jgi:hypothetical protein